MARAVQTDAVYTTSHKSYTGAIVCAIMAQLVNCEVRSLLTVSHDFR